MTPAVTVITLGVADVARARRFYADGFGWTPSYAADDIVFLQLNGLVLALWRREALAADMARSAPADFGAIALAHNVVDEDAVDAAIATLVAAGGTLLRPASAPPHGGRRGYVADPDGHAWEIAWNPAWPLLADGGVDIRDWARNAGAD